MMQEMSTDIRGLLPTHSVGAWSSASQVFNRSSHAGSAGVQTGEYDSERAVIDDGQGSSGRGGGTAPESGRSNLLDGKLTQ